MKLNPLSTLALTLGMSAAAHAAIVITPTSLTYTGTAPELAGLNLDDENNLINGNGLSATPDIGNIDFVTHDAASFDAPGNAWVTTDPGGFPSDFFESNGDTTIIFELTLDQTYNITDLVSWGYHFGSLNDNDISAVTIDYGVGDYASTTGSIGVGQSLTAGDSVTSNLGGTIQANQRRITVTDYYYNINNNGGDRVGIAELRLIGDVVPEPSSAALLGLGGLALILRRRK